MQDNVKVLRMCQVQDPNRGSFYIKVEAVAHKTYLGHQVYKDALGVKFIVTDAETA